MFKILLFFIYESLYFKLLFNSLKDRIFIKELNHGQMAQNHQFTAILAFLYTHYIRTSKYCFLMYNYSKCNSYNVIITNNYFTYNYCIIVYDYGSFPYILDYPNVCSINSSPNKRDFIILIIQTFLLGCSGLGDGFFCNGDIQSSEEGSNPYSINLSPTSGVVHLKSSPAFYRNENNGKN